MVTLGWVLTAGCAKEKQTPAPAEISGSVTIAVARLEATSLIRIALHENYFEDEGLDITVKQYDLGRFAFDALLAGEADIATVAQTPLVKKSFVFNDFRIICTVHTSETNVKIVARTDLGVVTPKDLKGCRIGTTEWTVGHYFLDMFLEKHGIASDEVHLEFMKPSELSSSLFKGDILAYSLREPYVFRSRMVLGNRAVTFDGNGSYTATFNCAAKLSFIVNRPETVRRFLRALLRAEQFMRSSREQSIQIIKDDLDLSRDYLIESWAASDYRLDLSHTLLQALEAEARWMIRNGYTGISYVPDFKGFVYPDALRELKSQAVSPNY